MQYRYKFCSFYPCVSTSSTQVKFSEKKRVLIQAKYNPEKQTNKQAKTQKNKNKTKLKKHQKDLG